MIPIDSGRALLSPHEPHDQADNEDDKENEEKNLGDLGRAGGNAAEAEYRSDDGNDEKDGRSLQHDGSPCGLPARSLRMSIRSHRVQQRPCHSHMAMAYTASG
jgi:hypothetical protein